MASGEKLWLFVGAEAPETWAIVERRTSGGGAGQRGLVPESYVGPDKDGEAQERAQALAAQQMAEEKKKAGASAPREGSSEGAATLPGGH